MIRHRICYEVWEYPDAVNRTRVDDNGTTLEWYSPADKVSASFGWIAKPYTFTAWADDPTLTTIASNEVQR